MVLSSEGQKRKLRGSGAEFCDLEIDGESGIVVDEENITPVLAALGAAIGIKTRTSLDGIVKVSLVSAETVQPEPRKFEVRVDDRSQYRCDHWRDFAKSIQKWVEEARLEIDIKLYFDINLNPEQDGQLHLLFSRKEWQVQNALEDSEGSLKAQCLVGQRYIRIWNLPDCPGTDSMSAAKKLLQRLLPLAMESDIKKVAEIVRWQVEERRLRSREQYIVQCSKRFEKTLEGTKQTIANGEQRIQQLQQEIAKRIREVAGAKRKLFQLEACKGGELERYGKEFDKLLEVPKICDVQVADGVVKVFTDTLFCADPRSKKVHEIGKFRIEIYETCSNGGVRWFNLTRRGPEDHNAPHVNPGGKACYGNTAEIWPELIGNYEFAAAAMVAIQFIESVNTDDDWGTRIEDWPLAEQAKEVTDAK